MARRTFDSSASPVIADQAVTIAGGLSRNAAKQFDWIALAQIIVALLAACAKTNSPLQIQRKARLGREGNPLIRRAVSSRVRTAARRANVLDIDVRHVTDQLLTRASQVPLQTIQHCVAEAAR